ncbi:DNA-binding transcriptional response regulator [Aestuariimicrobium ganziense]|uniref:response regulator transcription factor n=1 Tax=Aestuariimicrobium ganziense TaxID=2773677 RepID=UPI0019412181|nr:response regulator transcription factor [Aestuariimicrobium ganziense]
MSNSTEPLRVLVYSDDRTVRQEVKLALGRRIAADLSEVEVFEVATGPAAIRALDQGRYDALIFDGEATPEGGMGLAYQIKDEIPNCPPVLLLVARVADAWLATWSKADAISAHPVDPVQLPGQLAQMVRRARSGETTGAYAEPITQ